MFSISRDKICNKDDAESPAMFQKFRQNYNLKIIQKYRKTKPQNVFYFDVPTFPEFVDYLTNSPAEEYNEHWRPYFQICSPCHINYSAVLKLEDFPDDIETLVTLTGFTQFRGKFTHKTFNGRLDEAAASAGGGIRRGLAPQNATEDAEWNLAVKYFSQITLRQMARLYDIYRIDFEMFQYSVTDFYKLSIVE